ncbi:MAG: NUDIX domain-containing protein [Candidatus Paceibacterota bacterium]|jgi:isopentenyl-diphosphate delta-isomerase
MNNNKPKIIIVDENDNPVGLKAREEVDSQVDTYRCTGVWITNSNGEVLLAQRKFTKSHDPGKWGPAVAGTVEEGETYEVNALKEMVEEIGLTDTSLNLGPKNYSNFPHRHFAQWFFCQADKEVEDFVIQEDEVEQIAWVKKEDLLEDLKNNPGKCIPSLPKVIHLLV